MLGRGSRCKEFEVWRVDDRIASLGAMPEQIERKLKSYGFRPSSKEAGHAVSVPALPLPTPSSTDGKSIRGVWKGQYACGQGITGLTLTIEGDDDARLAARFAFYAVPQNPTVPSGELTMIGEFDAGTGRLALRPDQWIHRPSGYGAAGVEAVLNAGTQTLSGRMRMPGCRTFALSRSTPDQRLQADPDPPASGTTAGQK